MFLSWPSAMMCKILWFRILEVMNIRWLAHESWLIWCYIWLCVSCMRIDCVFWFIHLVRNIREYYSSSITLDPIVLHVHDGFQWYDQWKMISYLPTLWYKIKSYTDQTPMNHYGFLNIYHQRFTWTMHKQKYSCNWSFTLLKMKAVQVEEISSGIR